MEQFLFLLIMIGMVLAGYCFLQWMTDRPVIPPFIIEFFDKK